MSKLSGGTMAAIALTVVAGATAYMMGQKHHKFSAKTFKRSAGKMGRAAESLVDSIVH